MAELTQAEIRNQAITILELDGYAVEYLWHIDDVILEHPWLNKEQALEILSSVLSSESIIEEVNLSIQAEIRENYPEEKFDKTLELSKQEIIKSEFPPKPSLADMILDAKQKGLDKRYIQALQNKYSDEKE